MKAENIKDLTKTAKDTKAYERITKLCFDGSFNEIGEYVTDGDVAAQVVTGTAEVCSLPFAVFSQNSDIQKGAMSAAHCSKIIKLYKLAEKTGIPIVGIYDSCGAKVEDGVSSLESYSSLLKMSSRLSGVVPQIAIIAGVCASSAAMLAMNADVVIAVKGSEFFLSSPFNSDKTTGSVTDAANLGDVHIIVENMDEAAKTVADILSMLPSNNLSVPEYYPPVEAEGGCLIKSVIDADSKVKYMVDFGTNSKTFFARVDGTPVGIVKAKEYLNSDDCVKISTFVRLCDSFSLPLLTFVDCEGFADEGGRELRAVAKLNHAYSEATTAKITVIADKAYGQAFVALCGKNSNSDVVIALDTAKISPLCPEAEVMLLFEERLKNGEDRQALKDEYLKNEGSVYVAASHGAVDKIVTKDDLRDTISVLLDTLNSKRETTIARKHSNMPL